MPDSHTIGTGNRGILPNIHIPNNLYISSYTLFLLLGLFFGILLFISLSRKNKSNISEDRIFSLVLGGLLGGIIGSKIPIWIENRGLLHQSFHIEHLLSGRTIVGGLIGGTVSVRIIKYFLRIKTRIGNNIAPVLALSIAIGRIGCFLAGCCYGIETNLFIGVDFGDHIQRHPTQLYESFYLFLLFGILMYLLKKVQKPGFLFDLFLISYFSFRFFIEFIRVEPRVFVGLTWYQIASIIIIIYCLLKIFFIKKSSMPISAKDIITNI